MQRRHELGILSCYVDLNLLEEYANQLLRKIRLKEVYFAFDFSEIFKIGPVDAQDKLHSIQDGLRNQGIHFEWRALASSSLMHGKGYALIQRTAGAISSGVVVTTSANFTNPGFKGKHIELGYVSTGRRDIQDFTESYDYLWDQLGTEIDSAVFTRKKYLLKFALLSSGRFLHKWSGSLSQQVGIRYELTARAKERGVIAELANIGFEAGDTFTRQVLRFDQLPTKKVPRSFVARFTIETYWGRWCPSDAWDTLSESFASGGARRFIQQFQEMTEESKLEEVKQEALDVQRDLVDRGLLKPIGPDHLENWAARIQELRSNRRRLERFYTGYDAHELPYQIEQKSDVSELFGSLQEAIQSSKAMNIAKCKLDRAWNECGPELLRLTERESSIVREMSGGS